MVIGKRPREISEEEEATSHPSESSAPGSAPSSNSKSGAPVRTFFTSLPLRKKVNRSNNDDTTLIVEFDDSIRSLWPNSNHPSWVQAICTEPPNTEEIKIHDNYAIAIARVNKPDGVPHLLRKEDLKKKAGNHHIDLTTTIDSIAEVPVTFYRGSSSANPGTGTTGRCKIGSGTCQLRLSHNRAVEYIDIMKGSMDNSNIVERDGQLIRGNFDDIDEWKSHMNDFESIEPEHHWGINTFPLDLSESNWLDSDCLNLDSKYLKSKNQHFIDKLTFSDTQEADFPWYRLTFTESEKHTRRTIGGVKGRRESKLSMDFTNCVWNE